MNADQEECSYDYVFKLVVIGDSGVGKTNLLGRFVNNSFDFSSKSTIGLDLTVKNVRIQNKRIRVQIWDTAGQERYRSITKRYYRGAVGALIVFDITKRESFDSVNRWLSELQINESHPDSLVMVVGNKSDLDNSRQVSQEEAASFAESKKLMFIETSALNSTNVEKAFDIIIHTIFDKLSSKLATIDDKKAELLRGKSIDLNPPMDSQKDSSSSACAC